jgi:hypothetical protein
LKEKGRRRNPNQENKLAPQKSNDNMGGVEDEGLLAVWQNFEKKKKTMMMNRL